MTGVQQDPNHHRPLTPELDLAAILSHVEERVIGNDYTFSFAGQRYQIAREDVQAGMRRQRLRVELRLDGELRARYQGRYLRVAKWIELQLHPDQVVESPALDSKLKPFETDRTPL
jgi:hypothetical protein